MNKKIIYIIIVSALFISVVLINILTPGEPDWSMSFSRYSKEPYGNYLLYNFMKTLFPGKKITTLHDPLYSVLKGKNYRNLNYFLLNDRCVFDELDSRELLRFVSEGNNAFIAANIFSEPDSKTLAEKLGIEAERYPGMYSEMKVRMVNAGLGKQEYTLKLEGGAYWFSKFDKKRTAVLSVNRKSDPVYLRVRYGRGSFYLSTVPLAFTNYTIVSQQSAYAFKALSYLPVRNTMWDEFYKIGRLEATTPLRYILNRAPLRWAYIFCIITVVLVVISGAKRKQRVIPVIPPLANTTLEYAATVGSLYYQNRDHKDLAQKKINFFLDYIRSRMYLDTREFNDEFFTKLASKTGLSFEEIRKTFSYIADIRSRERVREHDLAALNAKIDNVYLKSPPASL